MSSPAIPLADAETARRAAAAILRESRFHSPSVPRPLHGVLRALGNGVAAAGRSVAYAVESVGRHVPGGAVTVWVVLGLVLVAAIVLLSRRYARRALLRELDAAPERRALERAADLEREAQRAEDDGRYGDAVRLRFRAGLADLAEHGVIRRPRSTPTTELARTLRSEHFDALARRFDEIAYGSAPAEARDVEESRRRWAAVVGGSSAR